MLNYTLTIRNAANNKFLRAENYPGHSGHAMMDEVHWWRRHYRERGIEIIADW